MVSYPNKAVYVNDSLIIVIITERFCSYPKEEQLKYLATVHSSSRLLQEIIHGGAGKTFYEAKF